MPTKLLTLILTLSLLFLLPSMAMAEELPPETLTALIQTEELPTVPETAEEKPEAEDVPEAEPPPMNDEAPENPPGEPFPLNRDNIIHQLFQSLGINLDYVPSDPYECFLMALQFLAAVWFIAWLVKMMYTAMIHLLRGGG